MLTPPHPDDDTEAEIDDRLDRPLLKVAITVVLGATLAVLDGTVINVALQTLSLEFETSFDTIQWVATGYLLALVAVIPVTGWACDRFGSRRVYLTAISLFLLGSVLAAQAWDSTSLIVFRVVQGLGGGMVLPTAMTIVTRAAGPRRVGRVMSLFGVPLLLAPIGGPVLGGWLVDSVGWQWIFYLNVPIGALALALAVRTLGPERGNGEERLDLMSALVLPPGLALVIFGLSEAPGAGGVHPPVVWVPLVAGLAIVAAFVVRTRTTRDAVLDFRLFRNRTFSAAIATMSLTAVALYGTLLLLPTYFVLVREESATVAGLLIAPHAVGAMITMPLCGRIADRHGAGSVVPAGLVAIAGGIGVFAALGADTPYWAVVVSLVVMGLGMGATMMPTTSAALNTLRHDQVARASSVTTIAEQTAGAVGSATMSIVLAALLAGKFGVTTEQGQLTATAAVHDPATHDEAVGLATQAFASTFTVALALVLLAVLPAFFLPRHRARDGLSEDEARERPTNGS